MFYMASPANSNNKAAVGLAVAAPAGHHGVELLVVDTPVPVNIRLLIKRSENYDPASLSCLTSTRASHSSSDIFSPRFIITCLSSTRLMNPLPS